MPLNRRPIGLGYCGDLLSDRDPPYWKETHVKGLFFGLDLAEVVVNKMSWSVGTLRTSTWKVQAQTVTDWIGKVLTSTNGKRQLTIITETEYQFRRSPEYKATQASRSAPERDPECKGVRSLVKWKKRRAEVEE